MKAIKTIFLFAAMAVYTNYSFAAPASSESVKQLMQLSGAGNMGVQVINQMLPSLKKMLPDAPEEFWSGVMSEIKADEMENLVIPVYQKHLSEEDVNSIIAFYKTPAGKNLLSAQPTIVQESAQIGQRWGQQIVKRVIDKYKIEVKNTQ